MFRRGGGEKIDDAGRAMVAACREKDLDLPGSDCDLVCARELDQPTSDPNDPLVLARITGGVAQLEVDSDESRERSVDRQSPQPRLRGW